MRGLRTIKRHAIEFGENEEEIVEREENVRRNVGEEGLWERNVSEPL